MKAEVHPVIGEDPVFVTVSCSWYPPSQDVTSEDDREHDPVAGDVEDGEGEGDGDGDGEEDVDGEGEGDGEGLVDVV
jgi:hypothetical protein